MTDMSDLCYLRKPRILQKKYNKCTSLKQRNIPLLHFFKGLPRKFWRKCTNICHVLLNFAEHAQTES